MIYRLNRLLSLPLLALVLTLSGCSVAYRFNGGTIDYTQIRSITIADVNNRASIVYPSFAPMFTERLKDRYISRTRLEQTARDGDLMLECTITGYDISTMAVGQDNYATKTAFTVTMQVKYTNHVNPKESFDRSFKAMRDFDRDQTFANVQDQLLDEITDDLIKQIFDATVENW